jgi:hypothetical protein
LGEKMKSPDIDLNNYNQDSMELLARTLEGNTS